MTYGEKLTNALLELIKRVKNKNDPWRRCLTTDEADTLEYLGGISGRGYMDIALCRHCPMSGIVSDLTTGLNYTCQHINGPWRLNIDANNVHRDCPLRNGPILFHLKENKKEGATIEEQKIK